MAMVGVDSGSLQADSQSKSFGLDWGRRPLGAVLHSSNEPGELSKWLCHDDSTINIITSRVIIIIFFNYHETLLCSFMLYPLQLIIEWNNTSDKEQLWNKITN